MASRVLSRCNIFVHAGIIIEKHLQIYKTCRFLTAWLKRPLWFYREMFIFFAFCIIMNLVSLDLLWTIVYEELF